MKIKILLICSILLIVCKRGDLMAFSLKSRAFSEANTLAVKYTCDGADVSPELMWSDAPSNTKSFALIMDDPDAPAGIWVHWVLYDLAPGTTELAEAIPCTETLTGGAKQGLNSYKKIGYGGPCPPKGAPHRYFFKLYALDCLLNLAPGATKEEVEEAMKGHILAECQLMGKYGRA